MSSNATNRWLDRLAAWDKEKGGTGTDYRLAQLLGIERQRVSRYRREADKTMGPDIAVRLAELLELHPRIVIAEIHAEQARDERERRYWIAEARTITKKFALAGAVILTALSGATPSAVEARLGSGNQGPARAGAAVGHCILCKVTRGQYGRRRRRKPEQFPGYKRGRIVTLQRAA